MTDNKPQRSKSKDDIEICALIERWAAAVREGNLEAIRLDHDPDILMFDVPPPFLSRGLDAYMATWDKFLSWSEKPAVFHCHDVAVTAGQDVAFATAIGECAGIDPNPREKCSKFRLTIGFRKIDGRWRIVHEHHSLPAE